MTSEASRTSDLPGGVAQVVISDQVVLAQVDRTAADHGLALAVGPAQARMEPAGADEVEAMGTLIDFRPAFDTAMDTAAMIAVAEPADRPLSMLCDISVNGIPDWALTGRQTVQAQFLDRDAPCTVTLAAPIRLPAHARPLLFQAALAAHRATGQLVLRRVHPGGETDVASETVTLEFDPDLMGGPHIEAYSTVSHELAPSHTETELHLSLVFDAYRDDGSDMAPYLFLADPHVRQTARTGPTAPAFVLNGPEAAAGAVWLRAGFPALAGPGETLSLLKDDRAWPLVAAPAPELTLLQDNGYSLQMTASEIGNFHFLIDGRFAFAQTLGPDPALVRMPLDALTGHYRRLTVMDEHQTRQLLTSYVLMPRMLTPTEVLHQESTAPFCGPLMAQAGHRYAALGAQMAATNSAEMQAQIAWALSVLEGGHRNVKLKPLTFPAVKKPDVSVVIPAHDKIEVTYLALCSLLLAHNAATFEVIVVDDASTDETAELEELVSGITVVHNQQAQRFIRACNAGAAKARGTYVALLNNDVEVTNGWLDALIDAFDRFDRVGLVGAKLLYPDGTLQDAGGIIWGSGNPWNYGNRENPWEPRFCYARQADYLSGAALMTSKEIWDEVGGLSSYLEPMYFEDTDFAFKVRAAGYTTWFVPSSVVFHYEGMTSGTDTGSGFKRYQEVNRPKFKRRWAADYARFGADGVNPDLEKDRGIVGRVLFIDYATPRPDRDAGSHAALQEIRMVQSLGYKVTFMPRNMAHLGSYTETLEKMGVEVIYAPYYLSPDEYLDQHATDFDAFFITRFYVARDVIDKLRSLAPHTKILLNNADLHFLRELRAGMAAGDPAKIAAARETRTLELDAMYKSDLVLSYNEVEHSVIQSHTDGAVQVARCPWVVEMPETVSGPENRSGLSFLGNYLHAPNAEAVLWFARQVMPLLEPVHPELELVIYGSAMPDEILALESDVIRPEGFVENISDAYDRHRIFIAPLLSGAGIKGKVLAALAYGIPCVLSPTAAEGIGLRHGHDCLIATEPGDWRDAISRLQTDDALWAKLSSNARDYVGHSFSFETGRDLMRAAFEAVDLYSPVA